MKFWLYFLLLYFLCSSALAALPSTTGPAISSITPIALPKPLYHGLMVQLGNISTTNITAYEIGIREDGSSLTPWGTYDKSLSALQTKALVLPYRNGIFSMVDGKSYCLRLRSISGNQYSAWSTPQCGIRVVVSTIGLSNPNEDDDGDYLSNAREIAMGTDPRERNSDGDHLISDGTEVDEQSNPNLALDGRLIVRTPRLDFEDGDPLGLRVNQHQFIELENSGDYPINITHVQIDNNVDPDMDAGFKIGAIPAFIASTPPQNVVKIPISFIPTKRGRVTAILSAYVSNLRTNFHIQLSGNGIGFPDCHIEPKSIDFGEVRKNDSRALYQDILFSNRSTEPAIDGENTTKTPWGFTLHPQNLGYAVGKRDYVLAANEEIKIPVLFLHPFEGTFDSEIIVKSFVCGDQIIKVKGKVTR